MSTRSLLLDVPASQRVRARTMIFSFCLLGLLACDGGGSGPTDETLSLEIVEGNGQTATVRQPAPLPLTVRVVTADGEPRPGVRVGFAVHSGEAVLSSTEAETDQDGVASVRLTLGEQAGAVEVVASGTALHGSPVTFHITAEPDVPATLTAESGNDQAAFVGRSFPVLLSALVTDRFGNPTPDIEVSWAVQSGGGSVSPATATTDGNGLVSTSWTAGPEPGENVLAASVEAGPNLVYTANAVSPGSGRIAVSAWGLPVGGIHLMEPDGSDFRRLPITPDADRNPVWSPDGSRIAFNTIRFGGVEVAVVNADGSGLVRATPLDGDAFAEVLGWSPDGTRVLVTSNLDLQESGQLYTANADGTGTMQLVPNTEGAVFADWSPDGEKIAFFTSSRDPGGIYVVDADGAGPQFLASGEDLRWSPDGSRIAFNGFRPGGGYQPSLITPDGSELTPFPGTTEGPSFKFQSWSPDGTKALFTANPGPPGDDDEFYSINADGTGLVRITDDGVYTLGGSWGP